MGARGTACGRGGRCQLCARYGGVHSQVSIKHRVTLPMITFVNPRIVERWCHGEWWGDGTWSGMMCSRCSQVIARIVSLQSLECHHTIKHSSATCVNSYICSNIIATSCPSDFAATSSFSEHTVVGCVIKNSRSALNLFMYLARSPLQLVIILLGSGVLQFSIFMINCLWNMKWGCWFPLMMFEMVLVCHIIVD